jgi:hypothetical protein
VLSEKQNVPIVQAFRTFQSLDFAARLRAAKKAALVQVEKYGVRHAKTTIDSRNKVLVMSGSN